MVFLWKFDDMAIVQISVYMYPLFQPPSKSL